MEISVSVLMADKDKLLSDIFGSHDVEFNSSINLEEGVDIKLNDLVSIKGVHDVIASYFIDFVISFSSGISAGIIANSIYNRISKTQPTKIEINGKSVELNIRNMEEVIKIEIKSIE